MWVGRPVVDEAALAGGPGQQGPSRSAPHGLGQPSELAAPSVHGAKVTSSTNASTPGCLPCFSKYGAGITVSK